MGGWGVITRIKANLSSTELGLTGQLELSLAISSASCIKKGHKTEVIMKYKVYLPPKRGTHKKVRDGHEWSKRILDDLEWSRMVLNDAEWSWILLNDAGCRWMLLDAVERCWMLLDGPGPGCC